MASMICYRCSCLPSSFLSGLSPQFHAEDFGTGFVYDALWELMTAVTAIIIAKWYSVLLYTIYLRYLHFLTPAFTASIPELYGLVLACRAAGFCAVVPALLQHKWKWLWPFHAVHHAAGNESVPLSGSTLSMLWLLSPFGFFSCSLRD